MQARDLGVDIALCLFDNVTYAAAQAERRLLFESGEAIPWQAVVSDRLLATGRRLARLATAGELVLFLGMGMGLGLGRWV